MQALLFPKLFREHCKSCSEGTMPNQADAPTYVDTYFSQGTGDALHGVLRSLFNQASSHLQINPSYTRAILVTVLLLVGGRVIGEQSPFTTWPSWRACLTVAGPPASALGTT